MEITITSTTENPLLKREEYTVTIDHSGEATPSADSVRKTFAAQNDLDPETVTIEDLNTNYGTNTAEAILRAYEEKVVQDDTDDEPADEAGEDTAEAEPEDDEGSSEEETDDSTEEDAEEETDDEAEDDDDKEADE